MRRQRGALEKEALDVLWDHGGWLTPAEVGERLDPDLAYTTVVTVLRRLYDKRLVDRERHGRAHVYRPIRTRDEQAAVAMTQLLEAARDPASALNQFVDNLDEENRQQLLRMLRRRSG